MGMAQKIRLKLKFKELHAITAKQDHVNLRIRELINDDKDPRWLPVHIIDDANAIILSLSESEGYPTDVSYISEKIEGLQKKLFQLRLGR